MKAAIFCFTDNARNLADKIKHKLMVDDNYLEEVDISSDKDMVSEYFSSKDILIFVGACGIAVRLIAPYVKDKLTDPAVLSIDEAGNYAVSLLSGHVGGANEAAKAIENKLGIKAVISTATDINNIFAIDEFAAKNNLSIINRDNIKKVSSGLLRGDKINVSMSDDVVITGNVNEVDESVLGLIYQPIVIGIGCRKNKSIDELEEFILETLSELDLSVEQIYGVASIDVKKDEMAIKSFCEKYHLPYYTYSNTELNAVEGDFLESEFVKQTVGVSDVSARAAKALGEHGTFILKKKKENGMTISVFLKYRRITFQYEKA